MRQFESDNDLDQLFKSADQATEIPAFEEGFWSEMESLLPQKKKRKGFIWWTSGAAVCCGLIFTLFLWKAFDKASDKGLVLTHQLEDSNAKEQEKSEKNAKNDETIAPPNVGNEPSFSSINANTKQQKTLIQKAEKKPVESDTKVGQLTIIEDNAKVEEIQQIPEAWIPFEKVNLTKERSIGIHPVSVPVTASRSSSWYAELGSGIGQSYIQNDSSASQLMPFVNTGVGFYSNRGALNMFAGIGIKASFPSNIKVTEYADSSKTSTAFKGVYGFEFPIALTYGFHRLDVGVGLTPGIQLLFNGRQEEFYGNQLLREDNVVQAVPNAQAATLQVSAQAGYYLNEKWQLRMKFGADVLRPFDNTKFQTTGTSRVFPMHGGLTLRRVF